MAVRRRIIKDPQIPETVEFFGGEMGRKAASSVHRMGDQVLSHGRRILATAGLHGAAGWHVPDDDPATGDHPAPDAERVVARFPAVTLTPGHFPRFVVIANPSGETAVAAMPQVAGGAGGTITVTAAFTNSGGSVGAAKSIAIPASPLQYAAQPVGDGAAWGQIYRRRSPMIFPENLSDPADLAAWSDGVTVALAITYSGSPRALDVVVYEEPLALAYDLALGDWIVPLHAKGNGTDLGQIAGPVPVTRRSADDPGGGAEILADAARRQCQEIGPVLWSATSWDEGNQDPVEAEAEYRSITGITYTELVSGATAEHSAGKAGWSMSSGANARRVQESAEVLVMRDKDNVVPVRCWIYCAMSTTTNFPTATVRFEAASYSIGEVAIPSGTGWAWRSVTGHLRCGLGAQDPTALQVRARCSTATGSPALRWRYLAVTFEPL